MEPKRSWLKRSLVNIGMVLGGALGVSAMIRAMSRQHADAGIRTSTSQQSMKGRTMDNTNREPEAVNVYAAPDHHPSPTRVKLRPGWTVPEHMELPEPTYWPAVMALGIAFMAWGLITTLLISLVGLLLLALALVGWIGDIHNEHKSHH